MLTLPIAKRGSQPPPSLPPPTFTKTKTTVSLKLEVPGIEEKDLDIRVENNNLIIKGERKFEREEKQENFRRVERQYGTFVRSFALPRTVDADNINANYDKGVLTITMPKRAEAKPKQIQVTGPRLESRTGKAA
jgi:HSP20 family protein